MSERILTLHPQGKVGVNILKYRYEMVKKCLLEIIEEAGEISYQDLNERAKERLSNPFQGSIPWYVVTVKLDLEARHIIKRVPGSSPHKLQMT